MNPFDKLRFERDEAIKERDDLQDRTDEEWLNEIGGQWLKLTGQPWETRDGETREEGLQANIAALFQVIETLTKERDEAQKKCKAFAVLAAQAENQIIEIDEDGKAHTLNHGLKHEPRQFWIVWICGHACLVAETHDAAAHYVAAREENYTITKVREVLE